MGKIIIFWGQTKAELLQLNYTQFPSLGIFDSKKVGNKKTKATFTQVGSPAVRLRLARCTAWVKRWSEAIDFL